MPRAAPAVRILPMSDKVEGFRDRSLEEVQAEWFLVKVPANSGRYQYRSTGLNAAPGTIVLFQFRAHIIASAVFIRDERFPRPRDGHRGQFHFAPDSFRTFAPLNAHAMRQIWPSFRAFGHAKQHLHPLRLPLFKKQLRHIKRPPAPPDL